MGVIRKCLFPAAGYGTRFLPATKAMPKEMLPIVTKPLIQYGVEEAMEAGITTMAIVTGRGKRALEWNLIDEMVPRSQFEDKIAERAKEFAHKPCYLLGAVSGSHYRAGAGVHNTPEYASSSFPSLAPRLYEMAGVKPADVDVLQSYENFTGGVLMSLVEHGFCAADECNDFFVKERFLAEGGDLPLNTSGGNLAECYMHGLGLIIEAARQIRGESTNPVADVDISMTISGPMVTPVSACIFGTEATL